MKKLALKSGTMVALFLGLMACGPSPDKEGLSWSHVELADYLRSKGLQIDASPTDFGRLIGAAMVFRLPEGCVYVQLRKSAQEAHDVAGTEAERAFSWGRFYFEMGFPAISCGYNPEEDRIALNKIAAILKVKYSGGQNTSTSRSVGNASQTEEHTPVDEEITQADAMTQAAQAAEANIYAVDDFKAALNAYADAKAKVIRKDYKGAKEAAITAVTKAQIAIDKATEVREAKKAEEKAKKLQRLQTLVRATPIDYAVFYAKAKGGGLPVGKRYVFRAYINHDLCLDDEGSHLICSTEKYFDDISQLEGFLIENENWRYRKYRTIVASMGGEGRVHIHRIEEDQEF